MWAHLELLADLDAFVATIKADADYKESEDDKGLLNYYVQEIRRMTKYIEAFLPEEIGNF